MTQKNVLIGGGILLFILVSLTGIFFVARVDKAPVSFQRKIISSEPKGEDSLKNEEVRIQDDQTEYWLNIRTGEKRIVKRVSTPIFETFAGLPKQYYTKKEKGVNSVILVADDASVALIQSLRIDMASPPSEFDGEQSVLGSERYMCFVTSKTCKKALNQQEVANVWWERFDGKSGRMYGHVSGEGIGNTTPLFIYDVTTEKLIKFDPHDADYRFFKESISPTTRFFALSANKDKKQYLDIYSFDDLHTVLKHISLDALDKDPYEDEVEAIAWLPDERSLVVAKNTTFYVLNIVSGAFEKIYTDVTQAPDGLFWDRNYIKVSTSGRYIVFLDYSTVKDKDGHDGQKTDLIAIDLKDNSKKILMSSDNVRLPYDQDPPLQ